MGETSAAQVRAGLSHPVIDADGHFVEVAPVMNDEIIAYIEDHAGKDLRDRYLSGVVAPIDTSTNLSDRGQPEIRDEWRAMPSWWGWQCRNTLDRATMHLPELLYQRLDEFGLDVTILYPSMTLSFLDMLDGELASVICRAVNAMHARMFAPYTDRMIVGALIPMSTPDMAVADLRYAREELGLRTAVIAGGTRRPIGRVHATDSALDSVAYRIDTYGIDSEYDYDPFWQACMDLRVGPVSHSSFQSHRPTRSISNYVYNHVGGLAANHESLCKSLFMGGVTNRFPDLRIGFLEGGVGWACSLYADMLGHWEKRRTGEIEQLDPSTLDVDAFMQFVAQHGGDALNSRTDDVRAYFSRPAARPQMLDEFEPVGLTSKEDFRDKFVPNFFFGCEADDPLIGWAFRDDINPVGAKLQPLFGSDISHWDVPDMTEPLEEAYELVEHGIVDESQFREFMFLNAVKLHAAMNPDFFAGTIIEHDVTAALAAAT
ncbi:MAG TPA: amidohydrolase family protein [Ilumatobacteraceae bacterium]|nr:amidohydrolase family protein [Ilumatobacteraceae bacterium]